MGVVFAFAIRVCYEKDVYKCLKKIPSRRKTNVPPGEATLN